MRRKTLSDPIEELNSLADTKQTLAVLDSLPKWEASKFSPLEVPQKLASALGDPQNSFKSVHVAGTNGKGSVCAFVAACLHESGSKVGQFVSPHLTHVTERCLLNGVPVVEEEFAGAVEQVLTAAKKLQLTPSYFVVTMLATFLVFSSRKVDWAVVEVGLGGLYDATSIIKSPQVSVITKIGLDHTQWLGESIEEIASNKAGIIKPSVPVVVGCNASEASDVCLKKAQECNSTAYLYGRDYKVSTATGTVELQSEEISLGLNEIELNSFHAENRALGIFVARLCGVSSGAIAKATKIVSWPGRTEELTIGDDKKILFDGLHNQQGALAFVQYLEQYLKSNSYTEIYFLLSLRQTKNSELICETLLRIREFYRGQLRFVLSGQDIALASNPEDLRSVLKEGEVVSDSTDALNSCLREVSSSGLVIVAGSLYLIGKLRPVVTSEPFLAIREA